MPEYIFNTTALSNFAAINRLELLKTFYQGKAFTIIEVSQGRSLNFDDILHYQKMIAALTETDRIMQAIVRVDFLE